MTTAVTKTGTVAVATAASSSDTQSTALMPEPAPIAGSGLDAALGALYAAMSQQREGALQLGSTRVEIAQKEQQQALKREQDAEAREAAERASQGSGLFGSIGNFISDVAGQVAQGRLDHAVSDGATDVDAAVHSPAFWNDLETGALDVAKAAAVVGSVAATVASGGAAAATLAGAALLLSVGGEAVAATNCLGKDSGAIGLGMEVGGAVMGGLGGIVSASSNAGSSGLAALGTTANVTSAGATVVAGAAHVQNAAFAADVQVAAADATQARLQGEALQRLSTWVVDDMKADDKARQQSLQAVQGAMQANDQAAAAAVPVKG
jgi:hypothetical protein